MLAKSGELEEYYLLHSTRADLYRRKGEAGKALRAYRKAHALARNSANTGAVPLMFSSF